MDAAASMASSGSGRSECDGIVLLFFSMPVCTMFILQYIYIYTHTRTAPIVRLYFASVPVPPIGTGTMNVLVFTFYFLHTVPVHEFMIRFEVRREDGGHRRNTVRNL